MKCSFPFQCLVPRFSKMGGNKRLEIQKGVITFSDKRRCDKGENVQRNTGSQEGMPKKRISRSYGYTFLKCCRDQVE